MICSGPHDSNLIRDCQGTGTRARKGQLLADKAERRRIDGRETELSCRQSNYNGFDHL